MTTHCNMLVTNNEQSMMLHTHHDGSSSFILSDMFALPGLMFSMVKNAHRTLYKSDGDLLNSIQFDDFGFVLNCLISYRFDFWTPINETMPWYPEYPDILFTIDVTRTPTTHVNHDNFFGSLMSKDIAYKIRFIQDLPDNDQISKHLVSNNLQNVFEWSSEEQTLSYYPERFLKRLIHG